LLNYPWLNLYTHLFVHENAAKSFAEWSLGAERLYRSCHPWLFGRLLLHSGPTRLI